MPEYQTVMRSKWNILFWCMVMAGVTYFNVSKAIDTGSYLYYFGTLAGFIATLQIARQIFKNNHDKD